MRIRGQSQSYSTRFHDLLRSQRASPLEAIALEEPRSIDFETIRVAITKGKAILDKIPQLGGEFLLRGVTGVARRDWGSALANLWIAIEQLTSYLSSPYFMYQFDLESLGLVGAYSGTDAA